MFVRIYVLCITNIYCLNTCFLLLIFLLFFLRACLAKFALNSIELFKLRDSHAFAPCMPSGSAPYVVYAPSSLTCFCALMPYPPLRPCVLCVFFPGLARSILLVRLKNFSGCICSPSKSFQFPVSKEY